MFQHVLIKYHRNKHIVFAAGSDLAYTLLAYMLNWFSSMFNMFLRSTIQTNMFLHLLHANYFFFLLDVGMRFPGTFCPGWMYACNISNEMQLHKFAFQSIIGYIAKICVFLPNCNITCTCDTSSENLHTHRNISREEGYLLSTMWTTFLDTICFANNSAIQAQLQQRGLSFCMFISPKDVSLAFGENVYYIETQATPPNNYVIYHVNSSQ